MARRPAAPPSRIRASGGTWIQPSPRRHLFLCGARCRASSPPPCWTLTHASPSSRLARLQVPFKNLVQWPPYFDHPFYSILPILAVPAFLFYDALARCAPRGPW